MKICSQSVFSIALADNPSSTDQLHHRMYEVIDDFLRDNQISPEEREDLMESVESFEIPSSFPKVVTESFEDRRESKCLTCKHRYPFLGHYSECGLMADVDVWTVKECDSFET